MMRSAVRAATLVAALTVAIGGYSYQQNAFADDHPAAVQQSGTPAVGVTPNTRDSDDDDGPDERYDRHHDRYREVTFRVPVLADQTILTPNCNPVDKADCIFPAIYPSTESTGDITGTAFSAAIVIGRNGVFPGASINAFTGRVKGCGTGGLLLTQVATFDPASGRSTGRWSINKDGGTGELADVAGGGTVVLDATGGRFEGRLRCR